MPSDRTPKVGELSYAIALVEDDQWECIVFRNRPMPFSTGWLPNRDVLVNGRHKSVTGALHTAQQMALDVLSESAQREGSAGE